MSSPRRSILPTIYRGSNKWRLTLFGRSLLLIVLELLANAACWIIAGILFARKDETKGVMSLALLAWVSLLYIDIFLTTPNMAKTIGLRHGTV